MPSQRRAVTGNQVVSQEKKSFARKLRRDMTPQEATLWEWLRGRKVGGFKFRRQQVIDGFVTDFYCASAAVVVEVDGDIHLSQVEYDRHRELVFASREVLVVRFSNARVERELNQVLDEIAECCRRRSG